MSDDEADFAPIVIDNGTGMVKAGFAGDSAPRSVFPNIVGRPGCSGAAGPAFPGGNSRRVGDDALSTCGLLRISHPATSGIVTNWDDMEQVWHHTFYNELRADPTEHTVMMTEAVLTPHTNSAKALQILFETFMVHGACLAPTAPLAAFCSGRTTACVVESGDEVSCATPVVDGFCLSNSAMRMDLAGRDITDYYCKILAEAQVADFRTATEREIARDMKEKHCHVVEDFDDALITKNNDKTVEYELPDACVVRVPPALCFRATEPMFKPAFIGLEQEGLHQQAYQSVMNVEDNNDRVRKDLFQNIVLSGGNTMFPGFAERLAKEVQVLAGGMPFAPRVIAPPERKYSVWIGGSILAGLSTFADKWMTKSMYDENGPDALVRMFRGVLFRGQEPEEHNNNSHTARHSSSSAVPIEVPTKPTAAGAAPSIKSDDVDAEATDSESQQQNQTASPSSTTSAEPALGPPVIVDPERACVLCLETNCVSHCFVHSDGSNTGHLACCAECAKNFEASSNASNSHNNKAKLCPMCRKPYSALIRIF